MEPQSARHLLRALVVGLFLSAGLGTGAVVAQNRVLFIGNSFTIGSGGGGVPGIFDRLAQAGGHVDPAVVMAAVGGRDFQYHSQDAATQTAIRSQLWTHVVLQNYSTEPTHLASGSVADHYTFGTLLYRQIMTNHPLTRVVLFETWSRAAAHALITGVSTPTSFASTAEFQAELRTHYHGLADSLIAAHPTNPPVVVAPVGTAWENAGGLLPASHPMFIPLFGSDNYHGNNNGYYLAACVIYSMIYGVSPHGLSSHPLVSGLNLGLSVSPTILEDAAWETVRESIETGVQSLLFDFGPASAMTTRGAAPNDPAYSWNNVTEAVGGSSEGRLTNLVTALNAPTGIGLAMLSRFNGASRAGTAQAARWPANASIDSLYGNTEWFNGSADVFPRFKLTGLDPARTYRFEFYASCLGVDDNRETRYAVTGSSSVSAALNPADNTDGTVQVDGITPDAAGEITIGVAPGPGNDSSHHFTYLGAMRMDALPPQDPIVFTLQPLSQTVSEHMPASFEAAVEGSRPYFVQWFSNGIPILDAHGFTYAIPAATTNMDGAVYSVQVSNLVFRAASSNAVLRVTPSQENPAGGALLFDFGGGSITLKGPPPNDDPINAWNNVTSAVGGTSTGRMTNLVNAANMPTTIGLVMLSRFNGANESGATTWALLPRNATRDSLFGNTESWGGSSDVFPRFKLTGLDPAARYDLTFYASRTGAGDNRETGYTVAGFNTGFAALNAADNITNTARVTGIIPNASREMTVSLAPTPKNNNPYHFTYLGVLRLDTVLPAPQFRPLTVADGRVAFEWTGAGQLEWASAITGPWTRLDPAPSSPHYEEIVPDQDRFFRLVADR